MIRFTYFGELFSVEDLISDEYETYSEFLADVRTLPWGYWKYQRFPPKLRSLAYLISASGQILIYPIKRQDHDSGGNFIELDNGFHRNDKLGKYPGRFSTDTGRSRELDDILLLPVTRAVRRLYAAQGRDRTLAALLTQSPVQMYLDYRDLLAPGSTGGLDMTQPLSQIQFRRSCLEVDQRALLREFRKLRIREQKALLEMMEVDFNNNHDKRCKILRVA